MKTSKSLLLAAALACVAAHADTFDVLIRGGTVIDGSGGAPFAADVGVRGDRIVFVGDARKDGHSGARVLDASSLVVAPGFIDPHTHAYRDLLRPNGGNANLPYLLQGVTTVFIGNDGIVLESDGADMDRIAATLGRLEALGVGTNVAMLVGHNAVRQRVMGSVDRAPTAQELDAMKQLVDQGMREGAFGISTGLVYTPGVFAKTDEVVELTKVAAARGGVYDTHLRDEGNFRTGIVAAVKETLAIGEQAKIPVHISHIKVLGTDVWGKSGEIVALMKDARARGIDVTASQYPYTASATHIVPGLLPGWARDGGPDAMLARLRDPETRAKVALDIDKSLQQRNGPAAQTINAPGKAAWDGKSIETIAREMNVAPAEAVMRIVEGGGAGIISFNMSEQDLEAFMKEDFVVGGSDGGMGHPRRAGTFARRVGEYVTKRHVMTLPFAIRQSTARTAEIFHVADRGSIAAGKFADLVVFDPRTYVDRATYAQPDLPPAGVKWVMVNGRVAVEDGKAVDRVLAGRVLRKQ